MNVLKIKKLQRRYFLDVQDLKMERRTGLFAYRLSNTFYQTY